MTGLIGIDPGNIESAMVRLDADGKIVSHNKQSNDFFIGYLEGCEITDVAIEMIASYGMPVGAEVFETCVWIGRFVQVCDQRGHRVHLVNRKTVVTAICGNPRAKDANVRQALLDLYGPQGTKREPGNTYGIKGDEWSALAIATWLREELKK